MKNLFKFLGIIALVAIIGFTIVSCSTNNGNNDNSGPMTAQEITDWSMDQKNSGASAVQRGIATQEMQTPGLTANHPAIPIDSKARIKNIKNRKEVVVTITGRIQVSTTRVIDVSPETAQALGLGSGGEVLIAAPLP